MEKLFIKENFDNLMLKLTYVQINIKHLSFSTTIEKQLKNVIKFIDPKDIMYFTWFMY